MLCRALLIRPHKHFLRIKLIYLYFRLKESGIVGYLTADSNGLCLTATGAADRGLCPTLVRIAKLAAKLDENDADSMVMAIDADRHKILAKTHGQTTTAVYKKY